MESHSHEGSQRFPTGACQPNLTEAKESARCRRRVLYHTHFTGHNLDSHRGVPCTIHSARVDLTHHLSGCELAR